MRGLESSTTCTCRPIQVSNFSPALKLCSHIGRDRLSFDMFEMGIKLVTTHTKGDLFCYVYKINVYVDTRNRPRQGIIVWSS